MLTFRTSATAALLALTLFAVYSAGEREPQNLVEPLATIPEDIDGWKTIASSRLDAETENVLSASDYLYRTYEKDGQQADFFVAYYAMQRAGEAMHSPRNCLPGGGWEIWKYDTIGIPVEGREVQINRYWIQKGQSRLLVLYWYQNPDRIIANEYSAKAFLVWDAVRTGNTSGAIVRVSVPDFPEAEKAGRELAAEMIPLVDKVLPRN
ncbi:MAG: EpsI family protein [Bryobacterales bacterium]